MSRLFISHSSKDSVAAIAFKQWLGANGWPKSDVFLDLEDIGAGEIWKEALRKAHTRCEAVILLASPDALDSPECLAEVRKAEDFGKEIIVVLLRDLTIEDRRLQSYKDRQIVDLSAPPQAHSEKVDFRGAQYEMHFNNDALVRVRDYLFKRGITPDSFPWPPEGRPDAEPFPGLSAFTEGDAGIFFGRDADILSGLDEFRLLRRKGSPRILAVQAASGAGKSSFLRAGLWPRLCRDSDYAPLAIVRPAQGILSGPEGLARKLAPRLSRPGAPVNPGDIYTRLMADDATKTVGEFADLMTRAAAQANEERRIANPDAPPPALVIAIDQAEELLASEDQVESQRFLALLAGLMREPPPGVEPFALLTVRADHATRLFQAIADQNLETPKALTLLPLPQTSYRDVIVKPIEIVARRGQRISLTPDLVEQLVTDATGADALPLLAFTLSYLYQGFAAGGSITLDQYKAVGGIVGSIDKAVKQALARPGDAPAIPAAPEEQFVCLRATFIPWLANIDTETNEPKRRVARLDSFAGPSRAMVDRLVKARLLVADRRNGADVVEVAHESLLRQWPALTEWLHAIADDLRVVASVERAAGEWDRNGRLPAWLDHRGDRLSAAERVAAREDFRRRLGETGTAYLKACRAREVRQRRLAQTIAWSVAAVLAIFTVALFIAWRSTLQAQRETEASLLVAKSELDLQNDNVGTAVNEAEQAFRSIPTTGTRSALLQAAMEISPHAAAAIPLGRDSGEALGWTSGDLLDFATGSGRLRTFDPGGATQTVAGWDLPVIARQQDGNHAVVRALSVLPDGRMVAVFSEGSVGVYQHGSHQVLLQAPQPNISVNPGQHAVAVAHSGAVIAVVTVDRTIAVYRCDWSASPPSPPACKSSLWPNVNGRVVAISPDERRIAVGDQAGKVTTYDLSGNSIGASASFAAPINALGWAEQRDWLAVGTLKGEIAVLDTGVEQKPIVQQQTFDEQSITALAWSPKQLSLAFTCDGKVVCLWRAEADAATPNPFKPAIRFEGHSQIVTRLGFAPSGTRFASGAADGTIRIWNVEQDVDAAAAYYADSDAEITQLAVSPDRALIAGGGGDGTIQIWDAKTGVSSRLVKPSGDSAVQDLVWNSTGAIAAIDENHAVNVIPAKASQPPINIPVKPLAGQHVAWADDGRLIAVPLSESGVVLLDPYTSNSRPVRLGSANKQAWGVASIPQGRLLISYVGGAIEVWDIASNQMIGAPMTNPRTAPGSRIGVGSMSLSPDARLLAVSSGDRFVTIYDFGTHAIWQTLPTESDQGIQTVAFSPDGQKLAALGNDRRLYIWTIEQHSAQRYLDVGIVPRRAIVGDAARRDESAGWLAWIANDRVAVATNIAAISVFDIDPVKWLKRIDGLAQVQSAPID